MEVRCLACRRGYEVRAGDEGKRFRCKVCGETVCVPESDVAGDEPALPTAPLLEASRGPARRGGSPSTGRDKQDRYRDLRSRMRSRSTRITIASFASVLLLFGAVGGSMALRVWGARGRQKRDREKIQNIMNTVVESSKLLKEIEEKKYETGGTKKEPDYVTKTAVCMYRFAGEKVSVSEPLMACIKGQMAGEPCFEEGEAHAVLLEEGTRLEMVDSEEFEIGEYAWLVEVLSGPRRGTRGWVFPAYVTIERTGEHSGMPGGD